jgi:antitoxin component of RelBE/YafQ-DinJ toxin-antitoxin module
MYLSIGMTLSTVARLILSKIATHNEAQHVHQPS